MTIPRIDGSVATSGAYFYWGTTPSTTTATASSLQVHQDRYTCFTAKVSGTGAVSATVVIQCSTDPDTAAGTGSDWVTLATITLSGTTSAVDGFAASANWPVYRANVTAISGTGATVEVSMGM